MFADRALIQVRMKLLIVLNRWCGQSALSLTPVPPVPHHLTCTLMCGWLPLQYGWLQEEPRPPPLFGCDRHDLDLDDVWSNNRFFEFTPGVFTAGRLVKSTIVD
jgi:hypothetical protein